MKNNINEINEWLENYIDKIAKGNKSSYYQEYEYADNYRWAEKGNKSQVRIYKIQAKHGCCGFYDEEVICPIDGKKYLIGFNYGH